MILFIANSLVLSADDDVPPSGCIALGYRLALLTPISFPELTV
ncbi:hypothetical protein [Shewanella sp. 1CM18E]|nr:hypothetical protein [Shewanella sp. 1CM18E]